MDPVRHTRLDARTIRRYRRLGAAGRVRLGASLTDVGLSFARKDPRRLRVWKALRSRTS